mgnify:CR=1 FL=1|tara:strand:- start:138 stop:668 length:531 start_codon:yes stop_codon:yes gene_type:complete
MKLIPNFLSFSRILLTLPTIYLLQSELYLLAALLFLISSSTDFFDGYLARRYSSESELGAFLDLIADKVLVISVLIWLVFIFSNTALTIMSILIVLREIIITSFRYYLVLNNADVELIKANKYGKLKTAFQFISIFLLILSPLYNFYLTFSLILLLVSTLISYFSLTIYFMNWIKK